MKEIFEVIFSAPFAYSVLRVTTPILFAALGAMIADKSGVVNIGLEGMMLMASLMGVLGSAFTGSALLGLVLAVTSSILLALVMAYFSLKLKTDIILAGIALNLFAMGATVFLLYLLTGNKGVSSSLKSYTMSQLNIPIIGKLPIIGEIISGHNILTYIAFLAVFLVYMLMFRTKLGLRMRAVGENEDAAKSVGINVIRIKVTALVFSGMMAGFGGAYMSMGYVSWFSANMTAGRGFIALAASAMGRSLPLGTMIASLFFGFADALSNTMQSLRVPAEFIQMIPYVATIVGLTVYSMNKKKKSKANQ
ncbi:MAG: ABC transporter permease [Vallitalea sp.]|jgi:simple sugar transport system permease protein|nr:ABC transporter permease [Vallitalea sp.]